MAGRWDKRAMRYAEEAGEGTVVAACRADPPAGSSLEGGLRSVAGRVGARLGRAVDEAIGRGDDQDASDQSAIDGFPTQGFAALVVGGRLVLFDGDADERVVGRWPATDVVLVSADDISTLTLNVTRVGIVFGDGTALTFDAPRQGYARDIDRFVDLLREAAGISPAVD